MKLKITLILTLLVSALSAQQWDNIGASAAFNNVMTDGQDMTILDNGQPVVAFVGQGSPNIKVVQWTGAAWISLPGITPSLPTNYSDLQLVSFGNTLYLGVGTTMAPGYPYMVYRLDGASWTDLDDGSLGSISYTPGSVKLAVSDQPNDVVLTFSSPGGVNGDLPNAYKYDGASWDVNYGDDLNQLFANELPGETNSVASRIFHNGPNTYYLSYQTEPFGGASITNGAQNKNGGSDELRLYKSDGSWEVLPFAGEDYVQNNPLNQYSIAGNQGGGLPYIAYLDATVPHNILFQQLDGANNYTTLPPFPMSIGFQVTALDMELDNIDFPYFAASDDDGVNKVLHYNGTAWDQVGSSDFTGFMVSEVDIEVFTSSNKVYVLYSTDGGTEMKVFNHSPSVVSTPTINNVCQDGGLSTVVPSLELNDQDHDSVYVVSATSNNLTVVQNANISITRISTYDYNSSQNNFKVEVTPEAGQSGFVDITVNYSDGLQSNSEILSFEVVSPPSVNGGADHVGCAGSSFTLSGTGSATTYVWDNGITDGVAFTPATGTFTYTVTGTDTEGCQSTDPVQITVNPLPTFSVNTTNVLCNGNTDGELNFSGLDGATSYNIDYEFNSTPTGTNALSSGTGDISLTAFAAGNYSNIMLTHNVTGCVSTIDAGIYTINEPSQISILSEADQVHCEGASVTLNGSATGGTGILVYSWDNGVIDGSPFTPLVGSNVPYTVTATDDNGCFQSDVALNITINAIPPVFTISQNNPTTCGGSDGDITIIGLQASTTYDVSYNDGSLQGPTAMTTNAAGEILISGLIAGTYSNFDITNVNGCTTSLAGPTTLSDPGSPSVNPIVDQTLCTSSMFTAVSFTGTGGAVFNWTNDNTTIGLSGSGTGDISGFTGSNTGSTQEVATIIVTPTLGGCTGASESFTLSVDPLDDAGFSYSSTSICEDEILSPTVSTNTAGGNFTYTTISGGPTLMLNASNGAIGIASSNVGSYDVTYTTIGTCPNSSMENINIHPTPTITITQPTIQICNNASPLVLEGIATPVGGNYTGAGIINNSFDPNPLGIDGYGYAYNYMDANGCSATDFGTIEILEIPDIDLTITNTTCGNATGSAISSVTGGLAPYTYYWSNGTDGPEITDLSANTYYLNLTDDNNCYVMDVATIQSSSIDLSTYAATDNTCAGENNGAIDLTVTGTTGPYTYYWSNGETTEDISNLYSGQYEVFVTDINGCMSTQTIYIAEPAYIESEISTTNPTSCGALDGDLSASITGGVPTYSYEWTNSVGTSIGTSSSISSLGEGSYTLTTTDLVGCVHTSEAQLSENGGPAITLENATSASCLGDGAIDISISSINPIQSINWSNTETTEDINTLTPGFYSVIVTDDNGCIGNFGVDLEPLYPDFIEICMVTVDTNTNTNLVIWEKPVTTEIDYFVVYRETSIAGEFLAVDTIQYEDESAFTDPVAYPQLRSWRYKLGVVNTCGIQSTLSPVHKTMHITYAAGAGGTFNINWDNYEGFIFPTFDLYRYTDLNGWELLSNEPTTTFSYVDTPPSEIGLDYIVSITPPSICTSTKAQDHNTSRSNTTSSSVIAPGSGSTDGISESELENAMLIYPNPSSSFFNVYLNTEVNNAVFVKIYDLKGSIIQSFEVDKSEFIVQLKEFETGMYILEINTGITVVRKQLIKK